jgi:peptidyl-prolyl cis-trans isomerase SurA
MAKQHNLEQIARYADMLSAMGTEPRLRIMQLLLSAHPEGMVVGDIGNPAAQVAMQRLRRSVLVLSPGRSTMPQVNGLVFDVVQRQVSIMGAVFLERGERTLWGMGERHVEHVAPETHVVPASSPMSRLSHYPTPTHRGTGGGSPDLSEEEALTAKLTLLNEVIVQEILVAKAGQLKIEVTDKELDTAYTEARKNIPEEAFQKELTRRNLTAADMRDGLRRELLSQKVVERELQSKVVVTDQEVRDFFNANRARFNFPEEAYHLAQIAITPQRDPQTANRLGDDAATPQAAAAKARMLMERLKAGTSFSDLAMDYSEDPQSAPRGGDLGFVPMSRLQQAPPLLRNAVLKKTPGSVSLVSQEGAQTIVLVVGHEVAGQRDLSMPAVRENITGTLRGRREQLLRAAYLTAAQSDAQVVNYLARRLVESQGKIPALGLAPPGGSR